MTGELVGGGGGLSDVAFPRRKHVRGKSMRARRFALIVSMYGFALPSLIINCLIQSYLIISIKKI